jgi:hypothetical protein
MRSNIDRTARVSGAPGVGVMSERPRGVATVVMMLRAAPMDSGTAPF